MYVLSSITKKVIESRHPNDTFFKVYRHVQLQCFSLPYTVNKKFSILHRVYVHTLVVLHIQDTAKVLNNLLSSSNEAGWKDLKKVF